MSIAPKKKNCAKVFLCAKEGLCKAGRQSGDKMFKHGETGTMQAHPGKIVCQEHTMNMQYVEIQLENNREKVRTNNS